MSSSHRAEALAVRALLPVRSGHRHRGHEDHEDEGPGLRRLQRARRGHQRAQAAAGLSILQQAHGRLSMDPAARLFISPLPVTQVCFPEDTVRKDGL